MKMARASAEGAFFSMILFDNFAEVLRDVDFRNPVVVRARLRVRVVVRDRIIVRVMVRVRVMVKVRSRVKVKVRVLAVLTLVLILHSVVKTNRQCLHP